MFASLPLKLIKLVTNYWIIFLCEQGLLIVQQLSTKIVQINDKNMRPCHNTYDPKANIFWHRTNPN